MLIRIFSTIKFLPCFSKILLIHFLPYRNSSPPITPCLVLAIMLLKPFYSSSSLEKLCSLSFKNFFKTKKDKKDKKMKHSRSNSQKNVLRRIKSKLQEDQTPLIPLSPIFYYFLPFTLDISKSFVINS